MNTKFQIDCFCSNIATLRKHYHLSKKTMAKMLGIGIGSLTQLERGILPPRLDCMIFFRLYDNFRVQASDMLLHTLSFKDE